MALLLITTNITLKKNNIYIFIFILFSIGCYEPLPDEVPIPTEVCVRTYHHHQPIPDATVYIKFNPTEFPGYDRTGKIYDRSFKTGADARGCIRSVPEGRHCLVAFGHDPLYYPNDVYGAVWLTVSLQGRAKLDTFLYISE